MSTFNELTDTVLMHLQGYSVDQDQITHLTASITASDLTLPVADSLEVSRGLVEIDEELIWVRVVDTASANALVTPNGRGWLGSTAATHAQNAVVRNNPKFPRKVVKRAITDTIRACYPDLYSVNKTTFTFQPTQSTYEISANADDIYDVRWDVIGPSGDWARIRKWRFVPNANATAYPSGKAIELLQAAGPGRTVQVTYLRSPQPLSAGSDDFSAVSGLPASAEDVVTYGACYRLAGYLDIPRLQAQSVEGTNRAQLVPPGSAVNASKYFYALYQERLNQEREILLGRYPRITHLTRM